MRISVSVFRLFQVLIVGLILCGPVFAAEDVVQTPEETLVTTPEPTPEITPEPMLSSTPEITPTATPDPTLETTPVVTTLPPAETTAAPTETPAAEPTPVVTDTPTSEPTPLVTEEPTAEPTPDSVITVPTTPVETPGPVMAFAISGPVAALSANKTSWSAPAAIRFYDRSTGSPTSWNWDFGDGTTSTVKNPSHEYSAAGTYTVTLTVTNVQGTDTKVATDYITVSDASVPVAALSANKTSWSAPAAIRFYDRSTGFPTTWNWDFGDGATSDVKNPEHVYASAGTYNITLTVTNPQGTDTKVATDYITVSDSSEPVAALSANKTSWSAPAAIRFYDRSTGFPTSWNWVFGDGTTSDVKNPAHEYTASGTYTVTLTVTNPQGTDTKVATDYITVSDSSVPVAALSANKTSWSAPAEIRFYDRSTGFPTSWNWDFGDGTTSTVKNPAHVYTSAGTYSVTLIVTNAQGSDTKVATDYITVSDSSVPVAALSANKTSWSAPAAIRFYDRSTGFPTSWSWDFGDGTTSTVKNPEHVYSSAGTYTVTLTVTNPQGSDTKVATDYITVSDSSVPVAALSANKTAWSAPAAIRFYDRSTGFPTSWSWDFGDGTTSDVKNPEHVYTSAGSYTVTLTVTNVQGSDTKVTTDYITVSDSSVPVAALSANKTAWSAPAAIRFYDRSTGFPTTWSWDFGDGTTSDVKNPAHEYTASGTYTVTLTVTNPQGTDTKIATDYITVSEASAPVAALSANKTAWSAPASIRFYDRSTGFPTSWNWDFGDGITSTVKNPEHVYAATGNYSVTLTVTNDIGTDTSTSVEYIHVYDAVAPVAALSANKTAWSAPAAIRFYDRSTGFPISWSWDFGDGTTSDVKNPEHVYGSAGSYTVTLTVTNVQGSDTKVATDYITVSDSSVPVAALSANKTSWSAPAPIRFYDRSTGFPTTWNWDFGDGTTSDVKNPAHEYTAAGTYTVTLTVTNDQGSDTKVATDYVTVTDASVPVAALSANRTTGITPAAIRFYDRSTGFPTTWAWEFGDGTTSTDKNPVHIYTAAGNYTINLTVTNALGSSAAQKTGYIRIAPVAVPLEANFTADMVSGPAPLAVTFTDQSTGPVASWNWSFGDGSYSIDQSPGHLYSLPGNYTVSLRVADLYGSQDTATRADYIRPGPPQFVIMTSANVTSGPAPLAVQFTDMTPGDPDQWNWSFGDGLFSDEQNPVHTYLLPGNFTLNRTVSNATTGNTAGISLPDYISVTVPAVFANFTAEPTSGTAPLAVNFTDLSEGSPTRWNWSFGDGNFSVVQHPSYTFLSPGNFTVNLTVDDGYGMNDTLSRPEYVRVTAPFVISNFTANATAGQAPLAVAFTDLSEGFPTAWNWSFGDGTFSGEQHPTHNYVLASNYTVSLIASNAFTSDNRTVAEYVKVEPATPAFNATVEFSSVTPVMLQGEHYLVDIKFNNTGIRNWSGNPASPDYVYLQGIGESSGDAARFNLTHIPMLFENETVAPGEIYDFFFFMEAPDITGNYSPAYQVNSEGVGPFGEISNNSVSVIENPFHPVTQPDGTKLYTTSFGNTSAGFRVDIVGPKVYLDEIEVSNNQDPRFMINPYRESNIIEVRLNDTFTYADITFEYNPATVSNPADLGIGYFNETTNNYTFVPTTIDTVNHRVTARVTHFSDYGNFLRGYIESLPVQLQTVTGYWGVDPETSLTIYPDLSSFSSTYFVGGNPLPPGNYSVLASGSYSNTYTNLGMYQGCFAGWATADSNPDSWSGMQLNFNNPGGSNEVTVSSKRVSSGILQFEHLGGPIGVRNKHYTNPVCGAVSYAYKYNSGQAIPDKAQMYLTKIENDVYLQSQVFPVRMHKTLAGCVLGQAGEKGNIIAQSLNSVPGASGSYDKYLGEDITESLDYSLGHMMCWIGAPEYASPRDLVASAAVGDFWGVVINGPVSYVKWFPYFKNVAIPELMVKYSGDPLAGKKIIGAFEEHGLFRYADPASWSELVQPLLTPLQNAIRTRLLGKNILPEEITAKIISREGLEASDLPPALSEYNSFATIGTGRPIIANRGKFIVGKFKAGDATSYEQISLSPSVNANCVLLDSSVYTEELNMDAIRNAAVGKRVYGERIYTNEIPLKPTDPGYDDWVKTMYGKEDAALEEYGLTVNPVPEVWSITGTDGQPHVIPMWEYVYK